MYKIMTNYIERFEDNIYRNRNITIFFITQTLGSLTFEIFTKTLSIYVFNATGSSAQFAITFVIRYIPTFLLYQMGGFLADRFDRKRLFIMFDIIQGLFLSVLSYLFIKGDVDLFFLMFVVNFIFSLISSAVQPVTKSIVPIIVPKEQLLKANSVICL